MIKTVAIFYHHLNLQWAYVRERREAINNTNLLRREFGLFILLLFEFVPTTDGLRLSLDAEIDNDGHAERWEGKRPERDHREPTLGENIFSYAPTLHHLFTYKLTTMDHNHFISLEDFYVMY